MAIPGQDLFETKRDQFSATARPQRFGRDYITAVNNSLAELCIALDDTVVRIDNVGADIDFDSDRRFALEAAIDYYLILYGHRSGDLDLDAALKIKEKMLSLILLHRDFATRDAAVAADEDDGPSVIAMLDQD
jgi:hypothetical protein